MKKYLMKKSGFASRIRERLDDLGITPTEAGRLLKERFGRGNQSTVASILDRDSRSSQLTVELAEILKTTPQWLITGKGISSGDYSADSWEYGAQETKEIIKRISASMERVAKEKNIKIDHVGAIESVAAVLIENAEAKSGGSAISDDMIEGIIKATLRLKGSVPI